MKTKKALYPSIGIGILIVVPCSYIYMDIWILELSKMKFMVISQFNLNLDLSLHRYIYMPQMFVLCFLSAQKT